jgi:S1-C subfamily serine protease
MRAAIAALVLSACGLGSNPVVETAPQDVGVTTALVYTVFFKEAGCTAVQIGGGRVVTAKHCVEDEDPEKDWDVGEKTSIGQLVYISPDRDFALLINQDWVKQPAPLMRAPYLGEHVYAVGYPTQLATDTQELTVTDGVISGPSDDEGNLRFTAPIYYGNSGGGVWANDGAFIGVSVCGFLSFPGMNFLVAAEDIEKAL